MRTPTILATVLGDAAIIALAIALAVPAKAQTTGAVPPATQTAPARVKEVALTEPQIQHVLDAQKDFDSIAEKMPKDEAAKPDPQIVAQLETMAKKHGFASYAEYNDVVFTISAVLNGFDSATKKYVGPEAVLKKQLAAVQADTKIPVNDKKAIVDEINAALKSPPPPVANKANVDLVAKNYDKIAASLQEE